MSSKKFSIKVSPKSTRNAFVLPMTLGRKAQIFKDKRLEKGGSKNLQDEYQQRAEEEGLDRPEKDD